LHWNKLGRQAAGLHGGHVVRAAFIEHRIALLFNGNTAGVGIIADFDDPPWRQPCRSVQ
jgi:hypothetical protein